MLQSNGGLWPFFGDASITAPRVVVTGLASDALSGVHSLFGGEPTAAVGGPTAPAEPGSNVGGSAAGGVVPGEGDDGIDRFPLPGCEGCGGGLEVTTTPGEWCFRIGDVGAERGGPVAGGDGVGTSFYFIPGRAAGNHARGGGGVCAVVLPRVRGWRGRVPFEASSLFMSVSGCY